MKCPSLYVAGHAYPQPRSLPQMDGACERDNPGGSQARHGVISGGKRAQAPS